MFIFYEHFHGFFNCRRLHASILNWMEKYEYHEAHEKKLLEIVRAAATSPFITQVVEPRKKVSSEDKKVWKTKVVLPSIHCFSLSLSGTI